MEESELHDDLPEVTTPRGGSSKRGRIASQRRTQPPIPPRPVQEEEEEEEEEEKEEEDEREEEEEEPEVKMIWNLCT